MRITLELVLAKKCLAFYLVGEKRKREQNKKHLITETLNYKK